MVLFGEIILNDAFNCAHRSIQHSELDIVFNFEQAYLMLDEFIMAGEIQETSLRVMIKSMEHADESEKAEFLERSMN